MVYIALSVAICFADLLLVKNKSAYFFLFIAFLIIGGFRDISVGTDTENYLEIYNNINAGGEASLYAFSTIEPLWFALNWICSKIFGNFQSVIFISNALAMIPVFLYCWAQKRPFRGLLFYVLLYFWGNSLNITRQMIAIAFLLLGYHYYLQQKGLKYILLIVIATLFHYTSILVPCVVFFLRHLKLSTASVIVLLPVTFFLGSAIVPGLIQHIPYIGKYSYYIMGASEGNISFTRILLNIYFIFLWMTIYKDETMAFYLKLVFFGICMYNLFSFSSVVGRFALFFMIAQVYIMQDIQSSYIANKRIMTIISYVYGISYFSLMLYVNSCEIVPYSFNL